jgi:FAD/FMN-containing dehydrogenase
MVRKGWSDRLERDLADVLHPGDCVTDQDILSSFVVDWTRRYSGTARAVVRPRNTEQVAAVLSVASGHGAAVIAQGGNTGLVGGSVPRRSLEPGRPQIVLSTRGLTGIPSLSLRGRLLDASAGTTLADAQARATREELTLGIDLSARSSATLGGMVATNAGGTQVLRYGSMRSRLAGLEAVLADGTVVSAMSGLRKDNVGPDLPSIFAGSEGTLAVFTRLLLHCEPLPPNRVTALVAVPNVATAVDLVTGTLADVASLESVELTLHEGMRLVGRCFHLPEPPGRSLGATAWLTLEAASHEDPIDELAEALSGLGVLEVAVARDISNRQRLWSYRDRHTEAIATIGIPHKLDVAVLPERIPDLIEALPALVDGAWPGAALIMFGHVADGNLHVNVVGPPPTDDAVDDAVFRLVGELGGSISAEHGIGVAKLKWLDLARPKGAQEVMLRLKKALDPEGILNPGVLFGPTAERS